LNKENKDKGETKGGGGIGGKIHANLEFQKNNKDIYKPGPTMFYY
jgi:hypothetical protein